jgi:hypothetical protein
MDDLHRTRQIGGIAKCARGYDMKMAIARLPII